MNPKDLEKYSSAFTLSDMEIFIFPELLYSLVLANVMSPEIWKWREDKWFRKIDKMHPLKRIHRVKQYIMDHYDFNLDLETWGLTDKETEINRFRDFIDIDILQKSNALFGYEGDKYYFDIDIRRHFGLDKYDTDIIPYWKTETVEAMNAFRFKPNHKVGAGECVSLATLYAAALFIVARIPLENIFLMGTPLHSQNFILVDDGVLTNNRRIVTRSMWFNGTELSTLARRALEHEQVTIVAHQSGYIHSVYSEATIDVESYRLLKTSLSTYLTTHVSYEIFINFLRVFNKYQRLFQLEFPCCGGVRYILLAKAFGYEHGSKHRLGENSAKKLLKEMDESEMNLYPFEELIVLKPLDPVFSEKSFQEFLKDIESALPGISKQEDFIEDLKHFVHTVPRLPSREKAQSSGHRVQGNAVMEITTEMTREEIIKYLSNFKSQDTNLNSSNQSPVTSHQSRGLNPEPCALSYELAFYAGRFMDHCDWEPFLKAVLERNPVSIAHFREQDIQEVVEQLSSWPDESIYEGNRLALPDEVVNFQRGDGIEKALTLANVIRNLDRGCKISLSIEQEKVELKTDGEWFRFESVKDFSKKVQI